MTHRLTSKDGTPIAYERIGKGAPVILAGGGLADRTENAPLARELASDFTVYNYDRRGRGESGDTPSYALEREFEDIEAVLGDAGGSACMYGASSGGALVLEAAAAGIAADKLAVYDVPYNVDDDWPDRWREYVDRLEPALAGGRRGDALALFMRLTGASDEEIDAARESPMWAASEAVEHTLAYDAACLRDGQPPVARLAQVTQPTLVATGAYPAEAPGWIGALGPAADTIAAILPRAQRITLDGQGHIPDPKAVAEALKHFFVTWE